MSIACFCREQGNPSPQKGRISSSTFTNPARSSTVAFSAPVPAGYKNSTSSAVISMLALVVPSFAV